MLIKYKNMLKTLTDKKERAYVDCVQLTLKNTMNKIYGLLGSTSMYYYNPLIAGSVTGEGKYAKWLMERVFREEYPDIIVVPANFDASKIPSVARFRSKNRLPVSSKTECIC